MLVMFNSISKFKLELFMRKLIKFVFILFIGVMCSACVNKFAAHELHNLAIEHIENGDTNGALARLESCVDLDPDQYQARYNLASIYIGKKQCFKALEHMDVAIKLVKNEPVAHYTLAMACDCAARELYQEKNKDGEIKVKEFSNPLQAQAVALKEHSLLTRANDNFEIYLKLVPNVEDAQNIYDIIKVNKERISAIADKYGHVLNANNNQSAK